MDSLLEECITLSHEPLQWDIHALKNPYLSEYISGLRAFFKDLPEEIPQNKKSLYFHWDHPYRLPITIDKTWVDNAQEQFNQNFSRYTADLFKPLREMLDNVDSVLPTIEKKTRDVINSLNFKKITFIVRTKYEEYYWKEFIGSRLNHDYIVQINNLYKFNKFTDSALFTGPISQKYLPGLSQVVTAPRWRVFHQVQIGAAVPTDFPVYQTTSRSTNRACDTAIKYRTPTGDRALIEYVRQIHVDGPETGEKDYPPEDWAPPIDEDVRHTNPTTSYTGKAYRIETESCIVYHPVYACDQVDTLRYYKPETPMGQNPVFQSSELPPPGNFLLCEIKKTRKIIDTPIYEWRISLNEKLKDTKQLKIITNNLKNQGMRLKGLKNAIIRWSENSAPKRFRDFKILYSYLKNDDNESIINEWKKVRNFRTQNVQDGISRIHNIYSKFKEKSIYFLNNPSKSPEKQIIHRDSNSLFFLSKIVKVSKIPINFPNHRKCGRALGKTKNH